MLLAGITRRLRPAQLGAVTAWFKFVCGERESRSAATHSSWNMPVWMATPLEIRGLFRQVINDSNGPRIEVQAPPLDERLSDDNTTTVLSDVQEHFTLRITNVIDDEIDLLRIRELCGSGEGTSRPATQKQKRGEGTIDSGPSNQQTRFDALIGPMWKQLTKGAARKRVPDESLRKVVAVMKVNGFTKLREWLEPTGRTVLADYNKQHNRSPIVDVDDFIVQVIGNSSRQTRRIRTALVKRFSRAASRF
jgi:hypothetical protein